MKRRSAAVWVENEIMGELVPPELDCFINRLKRINPATDAQLIVEHARKINTAYQIQRGRPDRITVTVHLIQFTVPAVVDRLSSAGQPFARKCSTGRELRQTLFC
jgi:hypothetical protein